MYYLYFYIIHEHLLTLPHSLSHTHITAAPSYAFYSLLRDAAAG